MRLVLAAILLVSGCALTGEQAQFDIVNLEAQASREVRNDELTATLAVDLQGADPAALAAQANRRMAEALKAAAAVPAVKASSGSYQTFPRYDRNQRLEGWRLSQELRLESADFAALAALIGRLQDTLVVRNMAVRLSHEARRAAEDALIGEAIAAFHARAELVRQAMKASAYRVRTLSIATAGGGVPRAFEARAMAQPVAVEPGESQVAVTASSSIQLR